VPTEYKSVVGTSQTEPSNGWRGEKVLWVGAQEAPFALTFNKVKPACLELSPRAVAVDAYTCTLNTRMPRTLWRIDCRENPEMKSTV